MPTGSSTTALSPSQLKKEIEKQKKLNAQLRLKIAALKEQAAGRKVRSDQDTLAKLQQQLKNP